MTVDSLVRGVTHAVLNELAVVRLLLDSSSSDDESSRTTAGEIVSDIAALLGELGALHRPVPDGDGGGVARVDLCHAVGSIARLLSVAAGPSASVSVETPASAVLGTVDVRALQVLLLGRASWLGRRSDPGQVLRVVVAPGPVVSIEGRPVLVGEPLEESA